jgi:hypothetical protein
MESLSENFTQQTLEESTPTGLETAPQKYMVICYCPIGFYPRALFIPCPFKEAPVEFSETVWQRQCCHVDSEERKDERTNGHALVEIDCKECDGAGYVNEVTTIERFRQSAEEFATFDMLAGNIYHCVIRWKKTKGGRCGSTCRVERVNPITSEATLAFKVGSDDPEDNFLRPCSPAGSPRIPVTEEETYDRWLSHLNGTDHDHEGFFPSEWGMWYAHSAGVGGTPKDYYDYFLNMKTYHGESVAIKKVCVIAETNEGSPWSDDEREGVQGDDFGSDASTPHCVELHIRYFLNSTLSDLTGPGEVTKLFEGDPRFTKVTECGDYGYLALADPSTIGEYRQMTQEVIKGVSVGLTV